MKYLLVILLGLHTLTVFSQTNTFPATGNVGIGTMNPTTGLLVAQGLVTSQTAAALVPGNNDAFNLYAGGGGYNEGARHSILWSQSGYTLGRFGAEYNSTRAQIDFIWRDQYNHGNSATESMRLTGAGNLGIGTSNPQYKLDVLGTIRAREIKVDMNGADFVFDKYYKLMPLTTLEKFVKTEKHLPDVQSAKEMQENGSDLGSLNSKLLQKIEELTLYLIEKDKKDNAQAIQIKELQRVVKQLLNKHK